MIKHFNSRQFDGPFRHKRLLAILPDRMNYKSLLYIGARPDRIDHIEIFKHCNVTIAEIWRNNVRNIRKALKSPNAHKAVKKLRGLKSVKIIKRNIIDMDLDRKFDVGMWWHGPEHVASDKLQQAIENLERHTRCVVVLGCPWGHYAQSNFQNPHEKHISHNNPEFFHSLGYHVETQGKKGPGSNIMSIKRLK